MLYKFKSKAGSDVIMLEATGKQVLGIMGKGFDAKGILLPEQMAAAKAALQAAIAQEEQAAAAAKAEASDEDDEQPQKGISLRTRAWPLVMLIERSFKENTPITWGV